MKITYLGPEYTNSHAAALQIAKEEDIVIAVPTFEQIFRKLQSGECELGIVPLTNTYSGVVNGVTDRLYRYADVIQPITQCSLEIKHCLGSNVQKNQIRTIYSKDVVFEQCADYLAEKVPHAELVSLTSTAAGALRVQEEPYAGAIASKSALHECNYIEEEICPNNHTRFLTIERRNMHANQKAESNNLALSVLSTQYKAESGVLEGFLRCFSKRNINHSDIWTRPRIGGGMLFYLESDLSCGGEVYADALASVRELMRDETSESVTLIGAYGRIG